MLPENQRIPWLVKCSVCMYKCKRLCLGDEGEMKLCNLYLMTIKQMSHNIVEVCGGFLFAMCML